MSRWLGLEMPTHPGLDYSTVDCQAKAVQEILTHREMIPLFASFDTFSGSRARERFLQFDYRTVIIAHNIAGPCEPAT